MRVQRTMLWVVLLCLGWGLGCGGKQPAAPPPPPEGLYVNAAEELGQISPYIYGTNFGPWMVVTADLLDEANAAGITFLRWPGGYWGDVNKVTPRQVDQLVTLARQMGAEPMINTRLLTGSPEESADLVRYANIDQGYNIKFWGIGNEPTLYDDYTTDQFNADWQAHAAAMRAVDPTIILFGPEPHQYVGTSREDLQDANGVDFLESFLETNGDLVDVVAIHRYPFPTAMTEAVTLDDLRQNSQEWDQIIPALRNLIQEKTGRDLPVAITEINSNWSRVIGGEATPDSHYNAIWYGDVLGRMINNEVDYVAHFRLQSNENGGGFGLLARYELRPTYYTFQMWQQFGESRLPASSSNPDVPVYAARRSDGSLTIMAINLQLSTAATIPLTIEGFDGQLSQRIVFDQSRSAEAVDSPTPSETVELPPQSMTLFIFEP